MTASPPKKFVCEAPSTFFYEAAHASVVVRCRRCKRCLELRRYGFAVRAASEQVFALHSWFYTWTFGRNARADILARATKLANGVDSVSERLVRASGTYVTTYLKRLRSAKLSFRYILVPEPHRDGFPHYHGVIFDQRGDFGDHLQEALRPDKSRIKDVWVDPLWNAGFATCEPVRDMRAIRYSVKYLSKERFGRVRVSKNFGAPLENDPRRKATRGLVWPQATREPQSTLMDREK